MNTNEIYAHETCMYVLYMVFKKLILYPQFPCMYIVLHKKCVLSCILQYIEEESESSVFDCRFSPDGLTFAATDALGHVILFGFGDKWAYRKVTKNFVFTGIY